MNEMTQQETPGKTASIKWLWIIGILIAIIFAIASLVIVLKIVQQNELKTQTLAEEISQLKSSLSNASKEWSHEHDALEENRQRINQLLENKVNSDQEWVLAEAQFLVKLANFDLTFQSNVMQALILLKTADKRIASLHDSNLISIRQSLANNIAQLEAVPVIDSEGILIGLNALISQIKELPIITTPENVPPPPKPRHHPLPGWKRNLEESWSQLRKLIVVQYHNQPVGELVAPENRVFLDMHLEMLLTEAQWAVIHQKPRLYQSSLESASNWVKNYFVVTSPKTQGMLQGLSNLANINIAPALPSVSNSLNAITGLISQKQASEKTANRAGDKP